MERNFWQEKYIGLEKQHKSTIQTLTDLTSRHDELKRVHSQLGMEMETIRRTMQQLEAKIKEQASGNPSSEQRELLKQLEDAKREIKQHQDHIRDLGNKLTLASLTRQQPTSPKFTGSTNADELASTIEERNQFHSIVIEAVRELTGKRLSAADAFYELLPLIRKMKRAA